MKGIDKTKGMTFIESQFKVKEHSSTATSKWNKLKIKNSHLKKMMSNIAKFKTFGTRANTIKKAKSPKMEESNVQN